jgi:hypothetical protein
MGATKLTCFPNVSAAKTIPIFPPLVCVGANFGFIHNFAVAPKITSLTGMNSI